LMIECQRKQQSLNLLSLMQLSEASISSSYLTSFFLFCLDLLESVYLNTKDLKQPCCHV
jgi:hypothetical protein